MMTRVHRVFLVFSTQVSGPQLMNISTFKLSPPYNRQITLLANIRRLGADSPQVISDCHRYVPDPVSTLTLNYIYFSL